MRQIEKPSQILNVIFDDPILDTDTDTQNPITDADNDGQTKDEGDCDDNDPNIYYGAPEILDDGIDQDCDGVDPLLSDADGDELIPVLIVMITIAA